MAYAAGAARCAVLVVVRTPASGLRPGRRASVGVRAVVQRPRLHLAAEPRHGSGAGGDQVGGDPARGGWPSHGSGGVPPPLTAHIAHLTDGSATTGAWKAPVVHIEVKSSTDFGRALEIAPRPAIVESWLPRQDRIRRTTRRTRPRSISGIRGTCLRPPLIYSASNRAIRWCWSVTEARPERTSATSCGQIYPRPETRSHWPHGWWNPSCALRSPSPSSSWVDGVRMGRAHPPTLSSPPSRTSSARRGFLYNTPCGCRRSGRGPHGGVMTTSVVRGICPIRGVRCWRP